MTGAQCKVRAYVDGVFAGAFEDISDACIRFALKRADVAPQVLRNGMYIRGSRLELIHSATPAMAFEEKLRQLCQLARTVDGAGAIIDETIRRLMVTKTGESLDWGAEKKKVKRKGRQKK